MTRAVPTETLSARLLRRLKGRARRHTLPCAAAVALISAAFERKLSLRECLLLRLHLLGCRACVRFRAQLQLLRALMRARSTAPPRDQQLSAAARQRISLALQRTAGG